MRSKIGILILAFCLLFLFAACDDKPKAKKKTSSNVISGKITPPKVQKKPQNQKPEKTVETKKADAVQNKDHLVKKEPEILPATHKTEHYNSQGKIDPFKPLIQDKPEEKFVKRTRPKRILTPLEKIELSQIRLVAVILMKNKQIAMVEEASGKGYEVGIGTYIGKNEGRVSF